MPSGRDEEQCQQHGTHHCTKKLKTYRSKGRQQPYQDCDRGERLWREVETVEACYSPSFRQKWTLAFQVTNNQADESITRKVGGQAFLHHYINNYE